MMHERWARCCAQSVTVTHRLSAYPLYDTLSGNSSPQAAACARWIQAARPLRCGWGRASPAPCRPAQPQQPVSPLSLLLLVLPLRLSTRLTQIWPLAESSLTAHCHPSQAMPSMSVLYQIRLLISLQQLTKHAAGAQYYADMVTPSAQHTPFHLRSTFGLQVAEQTSMLNPMSNHTPCSTKAPVNKQAMAGERDAPGTLAAGFSGTWCAPRPRCRVRASPAPAAPLSQDKCRFATSRSSG